ncbi:MAG: clan AA aspartic protease [Deltaproteobacteria bacterium]|nr:clan AA aspartic protease [Deltaproteobacteria bacterium]
MIEIPFPEQKHHFIIIPGLVYRDRKQRIVNFLIDTGASTTMVDPALMKSLGYTEKSQEYLEPATVHSPAGSEKGYKVKVQKILIHSAECVIPDLEVVCIRPERNVEALLGLNFLRHFHYCIDHQKRRLTLKAF